MEGLAQLSRVCAEVFQDGSVHVFITFLDSGQRITFDGDSAHRLASEILQVLEKAERAAHGVTLHGVAGVAGNRSEPARASVDVRSY
jgi:hypothetical protein